MAVVVKTVVGGKLVDEKHETADRIDVDPNGHLLVQKTGTRYPQTLSVHAPEKWVSAALATD